MYQIQDYLQATRWNEGSTVRHRDYAVAVGRDGPVWIDTDGKVFTFEPPSAKKGQKISFSEKTGKFYDQNSGKYYDPATKTWGKT